MINHKTNKEGKFCDLFIKPNKYLANVLHQSLIKLSLFIHDWQTIQPN